MKAFKAILVGAGNISAAWLNAVTARKDIVIVAVADPNRENAQRRISEFHLNAAWYPDLEGALQAIRADVVLDCSIPACHAPDSLLALRHGCHILTEKPMATTCGEARRIIQAAEANHRIHAVIQNRRYFKEINAFRTSVQKDIGELTTLNADFYIGAHFGGFRDAMKHVLLLDMAIHSFDEARYISGAEPVSVYCVEWNPAGSWYAHDASAMAIFKMSNGIVFCYRGSWCSEGMHTSWECDWRAIGTQGTVVWRNDTEIKGQKVVATGDFTSKFRTFAPRPKELKFCGHAGVINDFLTAIKKGTQPPTCCTDNINSLAMVEGAIRSAELEREVFISEL